MPRKRTAKATAPQGEAKAFRHTRTGAIRMSSTTLGFPFVPASAAEAKASQPAADAKATDK